MGLGEVKLLFREVKYFWVGEGRKDSEGNCRRREYLRPLRE